jgi:hypothetical protein
MRSRCSDVAVGATLLATLLAAGCQSRPAPPPKNITLWKPVGSWSGHGNRQTESFTSDTGGFRVRWSAVNETGAGMGHLRVVFRSGDSGREIIEAIDSHGAGGGTEEVAADKPRWYYLTIESADEDWTVAVDERIDATSK